MKNVTQRFIAIMLGVALCIGLFLPLAVNTYAEEDSKANVQKGEFTFAPHTVLNEDLTDIYYYSDDFFTQTAYEYNYHLATTSMILAATSISSQELGVGYDDKSRNLVDFLLDIGFRGVKVNDYYKQRPEEQTMGVGVAFKTVGEGEDAYTILAIVPRSAGYEREWAGNFTIGKEGLHEGFATGRDIILDFVKAYVEEYSYAFEGKVKVWTVGYSRGAGVANLLAAYLDDNSNALGVEVAKEDIYAYTFGTPSNVQYANEEEKALLENNYKNIHNVYSDYDIVTFAPFKNWGFTYYGNTKEFDVYNAERKAKMLTFLEKTNKTIYDLYTAEGSSADPDNFMPLSLIILDGAPAFVPADAELGIPTNQRDFLASRIAFLVEELVPDRATYVDEGYQYAMQCLTSLYFGLNAEQGAALIGGMKQDAPLLAAAYYCYFISEFYLTEEVLNTTGIMAIETLYESLPIIEAYVAALADNEEYNTLEWYLYAKAFIEGKDYALFKQLLEGLLEVEEFTTDDLILVKYYVSNLAKNLTAKILGSGIMALTMEEEEKQELLIKMTDDAVTVPLTKFFVYLLLGSEEESLEPFNVSGKNASLAVTFAMNAGRYMRVHNNEIILSWLRTEDTYYDNEDWHIHDYDLFCDEEGHWHECECGHKDAESAHVFSDWMDLPVEEGEVAMQIRSCPCGYEETRETPVVDSSIDKGNCSAGMGVSTIIGGVLLIAGGSLFLKKRED